MQTSGKINYAHELEELILLKRVQAAAAAGALRVAESYPTCEARDSGLKCQAVTVQEWPRGATPRQRSGTVAGRSHPTPEVRGDCREEPPGV